MLACEHAHKFMLVEVPVCLVCASFFKISKASCMVLSWVSRTRAIRVFELLLSFGTNVANLTKLSNIPAHAEKGSTDYL